MQSKYPLYIIIFIALLLNLSFSRDNFYAYHTKISHSSTDYFGKYADLIVVLGEDRQLEFTRQTQYLPQWVTPNGSYLVDDFYPQRDLDYNFYYNYVRLIEQSPDKIIVHWRYMPDIDLIDQANRELDPTFIEGFTAVVHEIFTIYPDGKVERLIKNAIGSRYENWTDNNYGDRQTITLIDDGIKHGPVTWGDKREKPAALIAKSPVKSTQGLLQPMLSWTFDEGGDGFPVEIEDDETAELAYTVFENVTENFCPISGHMHVFKKGVSGTALGFDGYYSGVFFDDEIKWNDALSVESWFALDVLPFNEAPLIHQSENFGEKGFYLGVDAYGKLFLRINGKTIKAQDGIKLYTWQHAAAVIKNKTAILYLDGKEKGRTDFEGDINLPDNALIIGLNSQGKRCTDYVRGFDQNIPFIYGIQGMMDEVKLYDKALSDAQVKKHFETFLPQDRTSPLKKAVLPGEVGVAQKFGASYKNLTFHDLWDKMWRVTDKTDIVVKFDNSPVSVVYWRGTNFAANWVTDNNRWMADQSSEIFTQHGCSEHMSDKQTRHSYARIIENNNARVVVHWRYPCVDVAYVCVDRKNFTDEYHTIYPDGTAIRKVVYNNPTVAAPGFQDIQYFTNPGEDALDVIDLNAVTVANSDGEVDEMTWIKPNKNPQTNLHTATIQYMNSKSTWKVYALYPEPGIGTWGGHEQSKYTEDPFAGPWNHWPVSIVPSDGRFAVVQDRVTHFALGAGNAGEKAIVHYGFTDKDVLSLVPAARYWQNPPKIASINGAGDLGFSQEEKAYILDYSGKEAVHFNIQATEQSPLINPAFVIYNCDPEKIKVKINNNIVATGKDLRVGREYDTSGKKKLIIWMNYKDDKAVTVDLSFK